jgi:hypothetical protein
LNCGFFQEFEAFFPPKKKRPKKKIAMSLRRSLWLAFGFALGVFYVAHSAWTQASEPLLSTNDETAVRGPEAEFVYELGQAGSLELLPPRAGADGRIHDHSLPFLSGDGLQASCRRFFGESTQSDAFQVDNWKRGEVCVVHRRFMHIRSKAQTKDIICLI